MPQSAVNELARQVCNELARVRDIGEGEDDMDLDRLKEIQDEKQARLNKLRSKLLLLATDPGAEKKYWSYAKDHCHEL
ncbi:hypothetical protein ABT56_12820 [Photobacterium aquae]|uniref:Uncharacterized protein n=1 Tax=Photobacterium aquae TaxID=1195763 RepID=A0A0J1GZT7_9GAMM|nr:hypothetical protein [Photobacterium aquae]KLV05080.1 hypothetical protein ABT56_12820 [Photobacterium aquae]